MRILVVEDDREAAAYLVKGLSESGHRVALAEEGREGLDRATHESFDALIIDRMLPGVDGLSIVAALRAARNQTPVLVLSALGDVEDRVKGLRAGCDDYLPKPFAFAELLARLRALGRREPQVRTGPLRVADLALDPITHRVSRGEDTIHLTARQYIILELLMRHAGQVLTRDQIAASAWDYSAEHASNVVDVFIGHLRRKIDDPYAVKLLATVRGVGYTLRDPSGAGRGSGP